MSLASALTGSLSRRLALLALCLVSYWPALNNGFIADDYVFLERVDVLSSNPSFLFSIPPENFRTFTYLEFLLLKKLFGYWATPYYLFAILLHFVNCLLVEKLVSGLTRHSWTGYLAALIFACFQNPQEAIMWLGGSHELPALLFLLSALNAWLARRWNWSLFFFIAAMFAKETAPVLLLLLPLADWWTGRHLQWRIYIRFWILALVFVILFIILLPENSLAREGFYALGPHAAEVLSRSLFRLAAPWLLAGTAFALWKGFRSPMIAWLAPLLFMITALLPYIFLTYQNHVPSRHEYLASVGVAALLSTLLTSGPSRRSAISFLLLFAVGNVLYIHLRKDRQFEIRAAPTNQLAQALKQLPPGPLRVQGFPYNGWIAKLVTRRTPGWTPSMIHAVEEDPPCPDCSTLQWDPGTLTYRWLPSDSTMQEKSPGAKP